MKKNTLYKGTSTQVYDLLFPEDYSKRNPYLPIFTNEEFAPTPDWRKAISQIFLRKMEVEAINKSGLAIVPYSTFQPTLLEINLANNKTISYHDDGIALNGFYQENINHSELLHDTKKFYSLILATVNVDMANGFGIIGTDNSNGHSNKDNNTLLKNFITAYLRT